MPKVYSRCFYDHKPITRVPQDVFVNVYRAIISRGGSYVDVGKQLGVYSKNVASRACSLRNRGVNMPYPKGHGSIVHETLDVASIAAKLGLQVENVETV